jgi:hypothetical protein
MRKPPQLVRSSVNILPHEQKVKSFVRLFQLFNQLREDVEPKHIIKEKGKPKVQT